MVFNRKKTYTIDKTAKLNYGALTKHNSPNPQDNHHPSANIVGTDRKRPVTSSQEIKTKGVAAMQNLFLDPKSVRSGTDPGVGRGGDPKPHAKD